MNHTTPQNEAFPYYSENVYAMAATKITGAAAQRTAGRAIKHGLESILGEIVRDPAYCAHLDAPQPPVHVYGLDSAQLRERLRYIANEAEHQTETYTIDGVEHKRRMRKNSPIAMVAIASYPGPILDTDPKRDEWLARVVDGLQQGYGHLLRSVMAHTDEGRFHIHAWIDDDGRPAKRLHAGHAAAAQAAEQGLSRAEQQAAYNAAMSAAQDAFFNVVGEPLGWRRKHDAPQPRKPRTQALAEKEKALEAEAERLRGIEKKISAAGAEWEAKAQAKVNEIADLKRAAAAEMAAARHARAEAEALKRKLLEIGIDPNGIEFASRSRAHAAH